MGWSSGSRITLLAEPSHPIGQWRANGFRPRSQRRVRNGLAPFSLMSLTGTPTAYRNRF